MEVRSYDPREHPEHMRASDAQREVVAELVRAALPDGRLQLDEIDERLSAVYAAKTHGELGEVIADIVPPPRPAPYPPTPVGAPAVQHRTVTYSVVVPGESDKTILPAFLLAFFLGPLGVHRFYVDKPGSGVAMLLISLTVVGLVVTSIWATVDWIILACGASRDGNGARIRRWT